MARTEQAYDFTEIFAFLAKERAKCVAEFAGRRSAVDANALLPAANQAWSQASSIPIAQPEASTSRVKFTDFAQSPPKSVARPVHRPKFNTPADRSRSLLSKLAKRFPAQADAFDSTSGRSIFAPAQPEPRSSGAKDPPDKVESPAQNIWLFVDHSNIIFGFLRYVKSRNLAANGKKARLDYHSLFAILERGRQAKHKVLVGSMPLYQSLGPAKAWHYEVHLLSRVSKYLEPEAMNDERAYKYFQTDSGTEASDLEAAFQHRRTSQEQAVDELLHGRMFQCLFEDRTNLWQTTIVLASGDGAKSEFSPLGFVKPIREAVAAGCKVEIVCFRSGCSTVWKDEEKRSNGQLQRIFLDDFVDELLE